MPTDPVLDAVSRAAIDATEAEQGWILTPDGEGLVVAATAGNPPTAAVGQRVVAEEGAAGYVLATGQPMAVSSRQLDAQLGAGVVDLLGRDPKSVLCVPCGELQVFGVLELVDKRGGSFSFDDVEIVTLLAGVAGAALAAGQRDPLPTAAELGAELERLALADPARYEPTARAIAAMLGGG